MKLSACHKDQWDPSILEETRDSNRVLGLCPMADGTIPPLQQQWLEELGGWLSINGEGIFGSRPWIVAESNSKENIPLRFTQKENAVYAFILDDPPERKATIEALQISKKTTIHLLGHEEALQWHQQGNHLTVKLPRMPERSPALVLKITPAPT